MLEVRELQVNYGPTKAVRGVSLTCGQGEFVAVLGSNGVGKTSLLRGIHGLASHRSRALTLADVDISTWSTSQRVEAGLTLIPEGREVFPTMTVLENLQLGYEVKRSHESTFRALHEQVMSLFPKLGERRSQPAGTMSGGEQQMLAIGRGLMQEPELLMLDEPSLGLAPVLIDSVMNALVALNASGLSILMVEQNARRALRVTQRVVVLRGGRLVHEGRSADLAGDDELSALLLGSGEAQSDEGEARE